MRLHVNETSTYDETLSASVRAQDPLARQAIEIAQLRAKISNYERESEHWSRDECRAAKAEMMAAIHDMKSLHEHTMAQELQTTKNQLDVSQLLVNKLRENLEESRGAVAKLLMEKQDVENELRSTRVQQLSTDFTIQQLTERTSMLSQTHDTSEARCRSLEVKFTLRMLNKDRHYAPIDRRRTNASNPSSATGMASPANSWDSNYTI